MHSHFMRITSHFLIAIFLSMAMPLHSAYAGMVGTDQVSDLSSQSLAKRERIRTYLDREDVRKELQAQGIDGDSAKARVDALTDQEVQKIAAKLDKLPAGGEILGILLTVFIVLLITDLLGLTKVFSFTRR